MDEVKEATKMRSCTQVELHTRSYNQEVERKYRKLFLRVKIAENVSHEFETKLCCDPHVCDKHPYDWDIELPTGSLDKSWYKCQEMNPPISIKVSYRLFKSVLVLQ